MRLHPNVEKYRIINGQMESAPGDNFGAFMIPFEGRTFVVICSYGEEIGWEHVSVSLNNRCPNWREMSFMKGMFWDDEETVFQFHPKKSEYVNNHPHCLHLWKPRGIDIPLPPNWT